MITLVSVVVPFLDSVIIETVDFVNSVHGSRIEGDLFNSIQFLANDNQR